MAETVSGNAPQDHRSKRSTKCDGRSMVILHLHETGTFSAYSSSCGWETEVNSRTTRSADSMQRHVDKKHGGRGLWL